MLKIKELSIGSMATITLVVMSATARETKAKKPYLQLELYDGTDIIQGNYWDWTSGKIPAKNSIIDVCAQVSEYQGIKQLNIKTITSNTVRHISEFEPNSGVNIAEVYKEAYALASDLNDSFLRGLCLSVLEQLKGQWCVIPGAKGIHHAYVGGTLVHSLSVAKIARAISANIPESNKELCFAGGLLHDLGKLFTYRLNGIAIDMTDEGMLYDHTFMGAEFIGNFVEHMTFTERDKEIAQYKVMILRHIILSHHGSMEYGAAVPPMCLEAHIVHYADSVDAAAQQIIEQSKKLDSVKWTDRIWALGNRPQLTTQYVKDVFYALDDEDLPFV